MKPSGRPILAAFKRAYSAQAQAAPKEKLSLPKQELKVSRLGDGTVLASLENYSPIARVAVIYNAGPCKEAVNQLGITHCLRNAFALSSEKSTAFNLSRTIQQLGGNLGCTTTREHMMYSLECMRDDLDVGVKVLGEVACRPAFHPWELEVAHERLKYDHSLYMANLQARVVEALHQAAYKGGLGQSLYCSQHKLNFHTHDMLKEFVSKNYTGSNMALVGTGVSHDQLSIFAREMKINSGPAPAATPSKYLGEQVRIDANTDMVYAAIATEGVSMSSPDLLKLFVLQRVMGSGSYVKYGSHIASSKVAKAAAQTTASPFAVSSFNTAYSDTGLFGFQVIAHASDVGKVIKSVTASMAEATKGSITDADVQRAKNQLKAACCMTQEDGATLLEDLANQAIVSGHVLSLADLLPAIDAISTADVQNIAKKVMTGRPCMAAVGDLTSTPYLDEIF